MAIFSLIFVAAVASVVSAAPQVQTFPDNSLNNNFDNVIVPFPTLPEYDYEIQGENNGNNDGNQNNHQSKICRPTEAQKNVAGMEKWCNDNCFHNPPYCPANYCQCY